jgi:hypothetical protein
MPHLVPKLPARWHAAVMSSTEPPSAPRDAAGSTVHFVTRLYAADQGLTLAHLPAQPKPFW